MMKIDARNVGKIIGPRGATIRELQNQFNVRISIAKENCENGMRIINIEGDKQNIQYAIDAINQKCLQMMSYNSHSNPQQYHRQQNQNFQFKGRDGFHFSGQRNPDYQTNDWKRDQSISSYQQQQKQSAKYSQDDNWDIGNVVSCTNHQSSSSENWKSKDIKPNFEPSLNAYSSFSKNSLNYSKREKRDNRNNYDSYGTKPYNDERDSNNRYKQMQQNYSSNQYHRDSYYGDSNQSTSLNDCSTVIDWDKANEECEKARKERWAKCPIMIKNFYKEHLMTSNMTQEEVDHYRLENNKISISRVFDEADLIEEMPKPTIKFEYAFEKFPDLLEQVMKQGFQKPSPIQSQMWPVLLKGEDCIGISQTGSGKTLAFLLPALIHIDGQPHARGIQARGGPNVLVLSPTRELAIQIEKEVAKYQFRGIKAVCLYGGNDRKKQIDIVESGCEIIIATPGRLNDLVAANYIKIESITYLVLDEADRMLDMGFEPQIRKILLDIRDDRQTIMTSATWPASVRRLASSYMKNPYQVVIGSLDLAATHSVTQRIEIIDENEKTDRIYRFISEEMTPNDKAIIFCGKKDRADSLSSDFAIKGVSCQAIHGNREQSDREQALEDIKNGTVHILIATDVASRGIDIEDITYVVNYDFPRHIEEYVHRVGRTGRAGRNGVSLSLMTRSDWGLAKELIEILKEAGQEIPEELFSMAERFEVRKVRGGFSKDGRGGNRRNFQTQGRDGRGGWH